MAIVRSGSDPAALKILDRFEWPSDVPKDTPFEQLTEDQKAKLKRAYRFSAYRPNSYQTVSGKQGSF